MTYKKRSHTKHRTSTRGFARACASLMIKGLSKCLVQPQDSETQRSKTTLTKPKPTKAQSSSPNRSGKGIAKSQRELVELADARRSGEMVQFDARVVKVLPDDNFGDRHQRFIIEIDWLPSSIQTVLIAHNIDLAPRVPVKRGSIVRFFGQYEWNEKGGLLHWTHHDPSDWREGGWIEFHGKRYG